MWALGLVSLVMGLMLIWVLGMFVGVFFGYALTDVSSGIFAET
jgi:hypothetical protein